MSERECSISCFGCDGFVDEIEVFLVMKFGAPKNVRKI
jgi:hypothetical protein